IPRVLMRGEEEDRGVVVENPLRAVAVMHVPINDGDALDLRITRLRITRGDSDRVEETEAHCAFARRMMTGRARGQECVTRLARHDGINRATRAARRMQRRIERAQRAESVCAQVTKPFADGALDPFEVLRRVRRL